MNTYIFKENLNIKIDLNNPPQSSYNGSVISENKTFTNEINTLTGDLELLSNNNIVIENIKFLTSYGIQNQILSINDEQELIFINQFKQLIVGRNRITISTTNNYTRAFTFLYDGSNKIGNIKKIYSIVSWGNRIVKVRLYDITNANVIAEFTSAITFAGETIIDLGTISNIPTNEAVLEFQMTKVSGSGSVYFYSGQLIFD